MKYQSSPHRGNAIGEVSITPAGRIELSESFVTTHRLRRSDRIELYWSPTDRALAFRFVRAESPMTWAVQFNSSTGRGSADISYFLRLADVEPEEVAGHYPYVRTAASDIGINTAGDVFLIEPTSLLPSSNIIV